MYFPPTWHWAQITVWWRPVSGNLVLPWSKVAGVQPFVVWQAAQVVGNPAARWFGFLVAWYFAWWQETQSVGVPVYLPPTWHWAHGTCWCAPVSGNRVLLWS